MFLLVLIFTFKTNISIVIKSWYELYPKKTYLKVASYLSLCH